MVDRLAERWDGARWRLWTFLGGVASVPAVVAVASAVALVSGERLVPLILLLLVGLILAGSLVGSGIIDTLSSQLNRGGLARESTDDVDKALDRGDSNEPTETELQRDRRTIRAGLFILAPIAAFIYFMTVI